MYVVSTSVEKEPQLVCPGLASPEELRDLTDYGAAFVAVVDELAATTNATRYTVTDAMATAAADALAIYALAKRLASRPGNGHLIPIVETMRRALGRTRPHPRKKATTAETAPSSTESPIEDGSKKE